MTPREELAALRRMKELEARAAGAVTPDGGSGSRPTPTKLETGARAATQGATAGYADEATGLIQAIQGPGTPWYLQSPLAALAEATSDVPDDLKAGAAAVDAERPPRSLGRVLLDYQQNRDSERRQNAEAKAANPKLYTAAEILSGVPLAIATGGKARGVGAGVVVGAAQGGVGALGGSSADLTEGDVGGALKDTALGAGVGGALGAGSALLGKALPAAARKGAELLERLGISQGRKVLTGGTKSISQAAAVSDDAVKRALEEGAIKPLGTTAGAGERLGVLREGAGEEYARIVRELEAAGIHGPQRDALAASLMGDAREAAANSAGSAVPGYLRKIGNDVAALPTRRVPGETVQVASPSGVGTEAAPVERLGLEQAENVKRSLQDAARKEYMRVGGNAELGGAKMAAAARAREFVESAIEAQTIKAERAAAAFQEAARMPGARVAANAAADEAARVSELAAQFKPAKARAADLIQAGTAADKALNAAQNKNAVSLRDLLVAGAGKDPAQKLALLPLSMAARAVGPSTVAAGSYGLGKALPGAAESMSGLLVNPKSRALINAWLVAHLRGEDVKEPLNGP